ncbi:collagen alpha-2(I) chain-like [Physeter macrocephalus]|uniref:Collagen alpha-2(I) chain-like n=1 Tax=Physeter macrocephalus TaxID=9755 RepID=A0A2Y9TKM4_PHYMC|nr:collagen alpha-2(I) chain-like [Physeter catodon]|eukprot:XP_023989689.1 collagen alpha-2(I) chain-like [Physeter catodon]
MRLSRSEAPPLAGVLRAPGALDADTQGVAGRRAGRAPAPHARRIQGLGAPSQDGAGRGWDDGPSGSAEGVVLSRVCSSAQRVQSAAQASAPRLLAANPALPPELTGHPARWTDVELQAARGRARMDDGCGRRPPRVPGRPAVGGASCDPGARAAATRAPGPRKQRGDGLRLQLRSPGGQFREPVVSEAQGPSAFRAHQEPLSTGTGAGAAGPLAGSPREDGGSPRRRPDPKSPDISLDPAGRGRHFLASSAACWNLPELQPLPGARWPRRFLFIAAQSGGWGSAEQGPLGPKVPSDCGIAGEQPPHPLPEGTNRYDLPAVPRALASPAQKLGAWAPRPAPHGRTEGHEEPSRPEGSGQDLVGSRRAQHGPPHVDSQLPESKSLQDKELSGENMQEGPVQQEAQQGPGQATQAVPAGRSRGRFRSPRPRPPGRRRPSSQARRTRCSPDSETLMTVTSLEQDGATSGAAEEPSTPHPSSRLPPAPPLVHLTCPPVYVTRSPLGPEQELLPWPQIPADPQLCEELKERRPVGGGRTGHLGALGASGAPGAPAQRSDPEQLPALEPLPAQKCPLNKRTRLLREAFFQPSIGEALRPQPGAQAAGARRQRGVQLCDFANVERTGTQKRSCLTAEPRDVPELLPWAYGQMPRPAPRGCRGLVGAAGTSVARGGGGGEGAAQTRAFTASRLYSG